ncbi:TPA: hypothetical protein OME37_004671 [Klebsiella michiganensis]|nr:hypothetical protein [Klebsiella michiganensis]ELS4625788.1 hypothetical protein [Klebsiella michiganensis]HCQ8476899.1 hypothetical protein [Klebsiella michiganensis]HCU0766854.1 hypothetical protein [Klebsiella michiganensis]HEP0440766.1 hypothetical protein [Klebsiella michiganensis]
MKTLYELIQDPYERKARLTPGLLVVLPLLVPLVSAYGPKNPILTGIVALLAGCGAMFALSNITRGNGKKLEVKLEKKWGGMPTTIILRHRDRHLDPLTKERYYDLVEKKLGIKLLSVEDERLEPEKADQHIIAATRRLRELNRKNKGLLLKENISYGFHRNMLSMKIIGIVSSLFGFTYGLILAKILKIIPPNFDIVNIANPGLPASLTLLISLALLLSWLFYFKESSVKVVGITYAERLFETLPSLKQVAKK